MGRKKVTNPRLAKTVSLPEQMWKEVDNFGRNRSKTIQLSLDAYFDWSEYDIRDMQAWQLAAKLLTRLQNNIGYDHQVTLEIGKLVEKLQEFDF